MDAKTANVVYHDWEADSYDEKWSISYDERCTTYAADRFRHVAGDADWPYERALDLGCGTGFFLLNLMQGGVAERGSVTDLSPGMVEVALRNAEGLGLPVDGRVADAERIPYDDDTFDLVVGHAVLHHIPDVPADEALRIGLVDQVVAPDDVYSAAVELATRFARGPAVALRAAKAAIDGGADLPLPAALRLESALFAGLFGTEDAAPGMRSYVENGPGQAEFVGR